MTWKLTQWTLGTVQDKTLSTHMNRCNQQVWLELCSTLKDQVMVKDRVMVSNSCQMVLHRIESKYHKMKKVSNTYVNLLIPGGLHLAAPWNSRIYPRRWRTWLCIVTRSRSCLDSPDVIAATVIGDGEGKLVALMAGWFCNTWTDQRWCCSSNLLPQRWESAAIFERKTDRKLPLL